MTTTAQRIEALAFRDAPARRTGHYAFDTVEVWTPADLQVGDKIQGELTWETKSGEIRTGTAVHTVTGEQVIVKPAKGASHPIEISRILVVGSGSVIRNMVWVEG